ncbi:MAG TPA: LCP family protein [Chloroflexota bacterium]
MWVGSRIGRLLLATSVALAALSATTLTTGPALHDPDDDLLLQPLIGLEATPAPTQFSLAEPSKTPERASRFERLMRPFLTEALRRRQQQAAGDPRYWSRVDPRLNATRLNFLLFGYGETHEPPLTERGFIGSLTIFSYDYRSRSVDLVSLTHDIRAPEIERHIARHQQPGQKVGPIKIDQAYNTGGFELMRRTLEDATGLAIDFQLAFNEDAIAGATDRVFGGLDVNVPLPFSVNAFYFEGKKYPPGTFGQGPQKLNGLQVIQFIKTVPVEEHYDLRLEHNARKHLVFRALMDALQSNVGDVGFLGRGALFFSGEVATKAIAYDFDLRNLLVENLWSLITERSSTERSDTAVPAIARTMYVVDPASGDGGVQWVKANARTNPFTQRDLDMSVYYETAMEVPYTGDPNAEDLVARYWTDVRRLIASRLS